jgi:hypothetical protein
MSKYLTQTEDSIKVVGDSGRVVFEVFGKDYDDVFRLVLSNNGEVLYNRFMTLAEIEAYDYSGTTVAVTNRLNAAQIAAMWNHRVFHLTYTEDPGNRYYNASVHIVNVIRNAVHDARRKAMAA